MQTLGSESGTGVLLLTPKKGTEQNNSSNSGDLCPCKVTDSSTLSDSSKRAQQQGDYTCSSTCSSNIPSLWQQSKDSPPNTTRSRAGPFTFPELTAQPKATGLTARKESLDTSESQETSLSTRSSQESLTSEPAEAQVSHNTLVKK